MALFLRLHHRDRRVVRDVLPLSFIISLFFPSLLSTAVDVECRDARRERVERERRDHRARSLLCPRRRCADLVRAFLQLLCARGLRIWPRDILFAHARPRNAPRGRCYGCAVKGGRGRQRTRVEENTPSGWRGDRKTRKRFHCDDRRRETIILIAIPQRSSPAVATDVKWSFKNIVAPDV